MSTNRLLIAARNPGKMREYVSLFRQTPWELVSLADLNIDHEVDETGSTFSENAWLKASEYAVRSGMLTLADDSGLEVDALGGEPGVKSARYGGDACLTDDDRVNLLLTNLRGVPWNRRTARFRCVIAVAGPPNNWEPGPAMLAPAVESVVGPAVGPLVESVESVVGSVAGMIQYKPEGEDGFGYDPVFYLPSFGRTMAQLPMSGKNRISHRGSAAARVLRALEGLSPSSPANLPGRSRSKTP